MQGAGNDFVVVDEWGGEVIPMNLKKDFVRKVCDRHFGIGSDGAIFVQKSKTEDVNFVFFNPDGSRAEMCGNGLRCMAKYVWEKEIIKKKIISVETLAGNLGVEIFTFEESVVEVKIDMGAPQVKRGEAQVIGDPDDTYVNQKVMIHGFEYEITAVGMGNPHAILFYDSIDSIDVKNIGLRIREYTPIFPNGVNVHFIEGVSENEFKIRTYERGVEDETLACGTGICASAVAAVLNSKAKIDKPIIFNAKGGIVKVELEGAVHDIRKVFLIGPAETVYEGNLQV